MQHYIEACSLTSVSCYTAGVTRIPVAVEAFSTAPTEEGKLGAGWWAAGTLRGLMRDGSVITSFRLAPSGHADAAAIAGFQAKASYPLVLDYWLARFKPRNQMLPASGC